MAQKAKIFISSSAQGELRTLREKTFEFLKDKLGHDPQMYEKNFGPWPAYVNSVQRCLDKVGECEIFLLYIYNKAGTIVPAERKTVTHLEFLEAYRQQKEIIVFAEKETKSVFFQMFKQPLEEAAQSYLEQHGRPHPSLLDVVQSIPDRPTDMYDDYTWVILYDLLEKGIYFEDLTVNDNGEFEIDFTLNCLSDYLSDMLRRGAAMLPVAEEFISATELVSQYDDYRDLAVELMRTVENVSIRDWRDFLAVLKEKMRGGEILTSNQYAKDLLGTFESCSGITLYKRNGSTMERVARDGRARGEDFYPLDDQESYVSRGYHAGETETLFYNETKRMLYLTSKKGEYVLSFHFRLNGGWTESKVQHYKKELLDGILDTQGNEECLKFAKLLLGGIRNEG